MEIRIDDLRGPEIARLLHAHLDFAARHSPPEFAHALDLDALRAAEITFWTVWDAGELLGCGALKELAPGKGEIKSMHTAQAHRGRGVARALLGHILAEARRRGYAWLYLETGTPAAFEPARALYLAHGFEPCDVFGDYTASGFNTFMRLALLAVPPYSAASR